MFAERKWRKSTTNGNEGDWRMGLGAFGTEGVLWLATSPTVCCRENGWKQWKRSTLINGRAFPVSKIARFAARGLCLVRLHKQVYHRLMNIKLEDGRYRNVQDRSRGLGQVGRWLMLRRADYGRDSGGVRAGASRPGRNGTSPPRHFINSSCTLMRHGR